MLRLADNPPMRPPFLAHLGQAVGRWWVAHTKARNEKAFAWQLHGAGINYFLPMVQRSGYSGGRKRKVLLPLFPSYVFFAGTDEDRYQAMCTGHVAHTIAVSDQAGLKRELAAIELAIAGKYKMQKRELPALGSRCRIRAGPLKGMEGLVVDPDRRTRVVLSVAVLGCGAEIEIEPELVEVTE